MKLMKKSLAAILALTMCLSLLPVNVLAADLMDAPVCGLEEHIHDDGCYTTPTPVPYCRVAAQHDCAVDDVYDEETGELLFCALVGHDCDAEGCYVYCGKEEHVHDEFCPAECPIEVHEHDWACFQAEPVLVCALEEHEHSDSCYPAPAFVMDEVVADEPVIDEFVFDDAEPEANAPIDEVLAEEPAEIPADVQAFLDAVAMLPEEITLDNLEEVGMILMEAGEAYDALEIANMGREDVQAAMVVMADAMAAAQELAELETSMLGASGSDFYLKNNANEGFDALQNWLTYDAPAEATIKVQQDVWFNKPLVIPHGKTVTVESYEGHHTIWRSGDGNGRVCDCALFRVSDHGSLIVKDVTLCGVDWDGNKGNAWNAWNSSSDHQGAWVSNALIVVDGGGSLTLESSAKLSENHTSGWGGGVFLCDGGSLTIKNGATFENCHAVNGDEYCGQYGATIHVDDQRNGDIRINNQPVYLAILWEGNKGQPGEPAVSTRNYAAADSNYVVKNLNNNEPKFAKSAAGIIDPEIFKVMRTSINGDSTLGLIDEGLITDYVNIDLVRLLEGIVSTTEGKVWSTNDVMMEAGTSGYKVVPYVVKYQPDGDSPGWHIDCIVKPIDDVTLVYDYKLPSGTRVTSGTLSVPYSVVGKPDLTVSPLGSVMIDGNSLSVNDTVETTFNGESATMHFLGWSTDPNATKAGYAPGGSITINKNTTLYAVWSANEYNTQDISYTVEYYKGDELVDTDTVEENVLASQTTLAVRSVDTNKYDGYVFDHYEVNDETVTSLPAEVNNGDVIKVYYVTKTEDATVNVQYYLDGQHQAEMDATITKTVAYAATEMEVAATDLTNPFGDTAELAETPYKVDDGAVTLPANVAINGTISVYYVTKTKDAAVKVEYYLDGQHQAGKDATITKTVAYAATEMEVVETDLTNPFGDTAELAETPYKVDDGAVTLPANVAINGTISVYYVTKTESKSYFVQYYKDNEPEGQPEETQVKNVAVTAAQLPVTANTVNITDKFKGYAFNHIGDDETNKTVPTMVAVGDTIKVYYTAIEYTITYELDGGTEPTTANPGTYKVTDTVSITNEPTKANYTFQGWALKDGESYGSPEKTVTFGPNVTGNRTYKAVWTEVGKSNLTIKMVTDDAEPVELGTASITDIYDGTGYSYTEDENSITFAAASKAQAIDKAITVDGNHYIYVSGATTGTISADEENVVTLTYTLDNWHDGKDPTTDPDSETSGDGIPDSQQVLVKYVATEGGSVSPDFEVITLENGAASVTLSGKATPNTGYEFANWNGNEALKADLAEAGQQAVKGGETYTYTASFTTITYTITVNYVDDSNPAKTLKDAYTETKGYNAGYDVAEQIGETLDAGGHHYVKESVSAATSGTVTGNVEITVVYALDDKGKPGETSDGIADKYQVFVNYVAGTEGGTVISESEVINLDNENQTSVTLKNGFAGTEKNYTFNGWAVDNGAALDDSKAFNLNGKTLSGVKGGETYTITASWTKMGTFTLTVNVTYENAEGEVKTFDEMTSTFESLYAGTAYEVAESEVGFAITVNGQAKGFLAKAIPFDDENNYVYVSGAESGTITDKDVKVTLVYVLDNWHDGTDPDTDPDSTTGGDGIPDSQQVLVKYKANEGGSVSPDFEVITLENGAASVTLSGKATPDTGYEFANWNDSETLNANLAGTTLAVDGGETYTYTASFTKNTYTIKVEVENGTADAVSPVSVEHNGNKTITFTANNGYALDKVTVDNVAAKLTDGKYTFTGVVADHSIKVVYAEDKIGTDPKNPDQPDNVPDRYQATVTYAANNGTVSLSKAVVTLFDEDGNWSETGTGHLTDAQIANATAAAGYNQETESWKIGDEEVSKPTTATAITKDTDYVVTFTKNTTYTVTYKDGADGSVFADKVHEDLAKDAATPKFEGSLARKGYVFAGWDKPIAEKVTGNVVYTAQWDEDVLTDPNQPDGKPGEIGDGIADKYQITVYYEAGANGSVSFSSTVVTKLDKDGNPAEDGTAKLAQKHIPSAIPDYRYAIDNWSPRVPRVDLAVADKDTFRVTFYRVSGGGSTPTPPTPPTRPTGGGSTPTPTTPTTTITDEDVPLAAAPGLNSTDHFAYVIGYEDNTVRPTNNITRAEVATIFFRLMTDEFRSQNWSTTNPFSDVAEGKWYNNAVSTTVKAGLVKGYTDGSFKPTNNITRAEFAAIAARFLSDDAATAAPFSDTVGHWAQNDIARAVQAGWIKGYPDGTFKPNAYITRAEVMTAINRMLDRTPDKDHLLPDMIVWADNPETAWYYEDVQEATNGHEYERDDMGIIEIWTALQPVRDWAALEAQWASANS